MRAALLTPWLRRIEFFRGRYEFISLGGGWHLCGRPLGRAFPETLGAVGVRFRVYPEKAAGAIEIRFGRGQYAKTRKMRRGHYILGTTQSLLCHGLSPKLRRDLLSGEYLWISVEVKK